MAITWFLMNLQLRGGGKIVIAKVRGVFGTLRHPHLILPYLAYYDHLVSHYGGPWRPPIHWCCNQKNSQVPESPVYRKMINLPVISVLTMKISHTKQPPYDFFNLYGACLQPLHVTLVIIAAPYMYPLARAIHVYIRIKNKDLLLYPPRAIHRFHIVLCIVIAPPAGRRCAQLLSSASGLVGSPDVQQGKTEQIMT
jgi:hypothetical protein